MNQSTLASRLRALEIERPAPTSLYARIGGRYRLTAFCRDLMGRVQADPQLGRFWFDRSTIGIRREEQLLLQLMCATTGGPTKYHGRTMVEAHSTLQITSGDWTLFLRHLVQSFDALGFDVSIRRELRAHVDELRKEIVLQ